MKAMYHGGRVYDGVTYDERTMRMKDSEFSYKKSYKAINHHWKSYEDVTGKFELKIVNGKQVAYPITNKTI